jgi:hypothetical protein
MQHPAINEISQSETAFRNCCLHTSRTPPIGDGLGETIETPFWDKVCRNYSLPDPVSVRARHTTFRTVGNLDQLIMMPWIGCGQGENWRSTSWSTTTPNCPVRPHAANQH